MHVGELARRAGIGRETVRFYQRRRLLRVPAARRGGFREYDEDDLRTLQFIRRAKGLGFTLKEIGKLLSVRSRAARDELLALLDAKEAALASQMLALDATRAALRELRHALEQHRTDGQSGPVSLELPTTAVALPARGGRSGDR